MKMDGLHFAVLRYFSIFIGIAFIMSRVFQPPATYAQQLYACGGSFYLRFQIDFSVSDAMQIEFHNLCDRPDWLSTVATWAYDEW
jgi:hypothetical protein